MWCLNCVQARQVDTSLFPVHGGNVKSQCRVRCDDSVNLTAWLLPGLSFGAENKRCEKPYTYRVGLCTHSGAVPDNIKCLISVGKFLNFVFPTPLWLFTSDRKTKVHIAWIINYRYQSWACCVSLGLGYLIVINMFDHLSGWMLLINASFYRVIAL